MLLFEIQCPAPLGNVKAVRRITTLVVCKLYLTGECSLRGRHKEREHVKSITACPKGVRRGWGGGFMGLVTSRLAMVEVTSLAAIYQYLRKLSPRLSDNTQFII